MWGPGGFGLGLGGLTGFGRSAWFRGFGGFGLGRRVFLTMEMLLLTSKQRSL